MTAMASCRRIVDEIASYASEWTGYRDDAIRRDAVEHIVRSTLDSGTTIEELHDRAARREPTLVGAVAAAVSVGVTFFFRQPEHFRWIASAIPRWKGAKLRAWSAGCATGEEAYSLAGCLADCIGHGRFRVLGTDLVERHVESARAAVFGGRPLRTSSPLLPLTVRPSPSPLSGQFTVDPGVRAHVRFERHNLLEEPPPCTGGFHIIVCRNVLLYFLRQHAEATADRLASALVPDGVLIFGALDVSKPPAGCRWLEPRELNVFERAPSPSKTARASRRASLRSAATARPQPGVRPPSTAPSTTRRSTLVPASAPARRRARQAAPAIALHQRALALIERGHRAGAERLLTELRTVAPDYLPGILEEALFHARAGNLDRATRAMRELSRRCEGASPATVVHGPETVSIEYYRLAARAYCNGRRPEKNR